MTREDQLLFLGKDKLKALKKLDKISPFFLHLSGSLSLWEYNVMLRPIGDLDIIAPDLNKWIESLNMADIPYQTWYGYYVIASPSKVSRIRRGDDLRQGVVRTSWVNRISFKLGKVNCCVFYGEDQEWKMCDYHGVSARVSHPRYAIAAKKKYVADYENSPGDPAMLHRIVKHKRDIEAYRKWLTKTIINEPI